MIETFISTLEFWHWFIAGVAFMVLELLLPGVFFLWMGLSALAVGAIAFFWPGFPWQFQLVTLAALSLVSVICYRNWQKKHPVESADPTLNRRGAQYVGRTVTITEVLDGNRGRAKLGDSQWLVVNQAATPLNKDEQMVVTDVQGSTLVVKSPEK